MLKQDDTKNRPAAADQAETARLAGRRRTRTKVRPSRPRNDLTPALELVELPISDLKSAERPVRCPDAAQRRRIGTSIAEFGCVAPILIDRHGEIIDGHGRVEALREQGAETAPCLLIDHLPRHEVRRLRIALNKIQERGVWDLDALKLEFEALIEINAELDVIGFEIAEIDTILEFGASLSPESVDPNDEIDLKAESGRPIVSRPGEVWTLGAHRILCGSARSAGDVRRLMAGEGAAMLFADPPYNVPIAGHVRTGGDYREFVEARGEMDADAFTAFLTETLSNAREGLTEDATAFVCMDWRHMRELDDALAANRLDLVNVCVWVKPNGGMGSLYRSRHELVFVARPRGARGRNNVQLGRFGRNRTNVWEYAGASGGSASPDDDFTLHPTVKPIGLVADAILDVTAPGDPLLDPFLGSGTSVLAAERTGRRCRGLEIDPAYVDVAIRRWERMTGGAAISEEEKTFADRERRRERDDQSGHDEGDQ